MNGRGRTQGNIYMYKHGVPMPEPVDFGVCDNGESVYYVTKWCDGEKLEDILPTLSSEEQYAIGVNAGQLVAKISAVPVEERELANPDWYERYNSFMYESIRWFHKSGVEVANARSITDYFYENRYLLKTRPQCYFHDDLQPGNMLLTAEQDIIVIDWEVHLFDNYGDPWWRSDYMNETPPHSATGFVHGWFGGEPPDEFWRVMMLYKVIGALSVITWAYYHSPGSLEDVTNNCANSKFLEWHGGDICKIVPDWYLK